MGTPCGPRDFKRKTPFANHSTEPDLNFTVHVLHLTNSIVAALELFQHYVMSEPSSQITEKTHER